VATEDNVLTHIEKMQCAHVFVVGDLILDVYVEGTVHRISPEAPVPILLEKQRRAVLGGAGNVASNISTFGAQVWLSGRLGSDSESEEFMTLCRQVGVNTEAVVQDRDFPTTRKTRILSGYQQLARIDREEVKELTIDIEERVLNSFERFSKILGPKALVLSDYTKGFLTRSLCEKIIEMAVELNIPIVVDPKTSDLSRFRNATVLKPNLKYGRAFVRKNVNYVAKNSSLEEEVSEICTSLLLESGAHHILLSLSEHGVALAGSKSKGVLDLIPSQSLQVADVSGAGDTMVAFLAMSLAGGLSMKQAAILSNLASGISCGKLGTATVNPEEFVAHLPHSSLFGEGNKIVQSGQLSRFAKHLRKFEKSVVFTNGCFDILHTGHLKLLEQAKSLGDILVVGLNSDSSVQRLKGSTRPLQNETDRAHLLAGLACVDFVVVFDEDTPLKLLMEIKPQVLVKGGDYTKETIVGAREVEEYGGKIAIIDLIQGKSTTGIVKLIESNKA
jgi:D-beta-D-heptose 7-phosphate kinase/D-beta-D-heptose 1-phosphate adenosyltransferase